MKAISILLFASFFCVSTCFADSTETWASVKKDAAKRCAKNFPDFQLQAICMKNEHKGFERMQKTFGLPADIELAAKERCKSTFEDFQLQPVCMENEKKGYDQMKQYQ